MKILLSGNLGYIGPIVARHLKQSIPGCFVAGLDSGYFAGCLVDPKIFPERYVDVQHIADVRTVPSEIFRGFDAVVQLAAISNDPMGNKFESVTHEVNTLAAVRAANAAKAAGVRSFVFASSCSVYGAGGEGAKSETSPLNPLTAYARSKIAAEEALAPLASEDFIVTSLRFATACGFSPRLRLDLVLNDFVASALTTGKITILSDGTPWRPLIHVADMARAMQWGIQRSVQNGGSNVVVNAGSDAWNYQVVDLAKAVAQQLSGVVYSINPAAAPDKRSYRVSFARFRELAPSFQPKETLESTVSELVMHLKAVGFSDATFRESNLIRLKVLADLTTKSLLKPDLTWANL